MLTVICGEDIIASRNFIQSLKSDYKKKHFDIQNIAPQQLEEVYKDSGGVMSLFGQQSVYFVEKLAAYISKKKKSSFDEVMQSLIENKTIIIVDWEEGKSAYELTSLKKKTNDFKEFKPEKSIFQLLDTCYPTNLKGFLHAIETVNQTQDDTFIFAMLAKHIRTLILAKENALDTKMSPWQKMNVTKQAKLWDANKLIGFYEGMGRVDVAIKSSNTPFNLKKSLDILACYYL